MAPIEDIITFQDMVVEIFKLFVFEFIKIFLDFTKLIDTDNYSLVAKKLKKTRKNFDKFTKENL